jgi:hypothetical protein
MPEPKLPRLPPRDPDPQDPYPDPDPRGPNPDEPGPDVNNPVIDPESDPKPLRLKSASNGGPGRNLQSLRSDSLETADFSRCPDGRGLFAPS